MPESPKKRIVRSLLFVVVVFAVGIAGVFVGNALRTRVPGRGPTTVTMPLPKSLLETGDEFPEVELIDERGHTVSSLDITPGGGVVLFLDLECPPCTEMAERWQRMRDEGSIDNAALCAVTYHAPDVIRAYKDEHAIALPMFRDSLQTFRHEHRVDRFPLEVVVGRSGRIRSMNYDSTSPTDPGELGLYLDN